MTAYSLLPILGLVLVIQAPRNTLYVMPDHHLCSHLQLHEKNIFYTSEEEEEVDMYANMSQERLKQFNFILDDLNRKFLGQGSQPR